MTILDFSYPKVEDADIEAHWQSLSALFHSHIVTLQKTYPITGFSFNTDKFTLYTSKCPSDISLGYLDNSSFSELFVDSIPVLSVSLPGSSL